MAENTEIHNDEVKEMGPGEIPEEKK